MNNFNEVCVFQTTQVLDAIKVLESSSLQIVLVVDELRRLKGTVTDGDIRRGILNGVSMDVQVSRVMNPRPTTCSPHASQAEVLELMRHRQLAHVPRVDADGCVVGLETLANLVERTALDNWIVLMAGGRGTRLRPLTETTPKPMLPVGGRPLLEIIVSSLVGQGFTRIFLAVNYKSEMLRGHFGDGGRFGASIEYLEEKDELGTAGGLTLLEERPTAPLIIMNADVLTSVDFRHLLAFHHEHGADATMCVREYSLQIPYGIVEVDGHRFAGIEEKPAHQYFINGGIYVLEPHTLDLLPRGKRSDMPTLFDELRRRNRPVSVFPVREYWLDVGRLEDLHRADSEVGDVF